MKFERLARFFSSKEPAVEEIVEAIILVSRKWFLAKKDDLIFFYEWLSNSLIV